MTALVIFGLIVVVLKWPEGPGENPLTLTLLIFGALITAINWDYHFLSSL